MSTPEAPSPLEQALDGLTQALEGWSPDTSPSVAPILAALRELHLRFDPRKDRLSAALCMTSMKLLEELDRSGTIGAEGAVGAVDELAHGLRSTLADAVAPPTIQRSPARTEVVLSTSDASGGLSLAFDSVERRPIGELMVKMGMLTREQVETILEVQAKAEEEGGERLRFGEIAVELGFAGESMVESALRLQSRSQGETPEPAKAADPWGNSPL